MDEVNWVNWGVESSDMLCFVLHWSIHRMEFFPLMTSQWLHGSEMIARASVNKDMSSKHVTAQFLVSYPSKTSVGVVESCIFLTFIVVHHLFTTCFERDVRGCDRVSLS